MDAVKRADYLDAAADILERDGWCQGALHRGGRHCAEGALAVVTGYHHMTGPRSDCATSIVSRSYAWAEVRWALSDVLGSAVHAWNDRPTQNQETVIRRLRSAAKTIRDRARDRAAQTVLP